MISVIDFWFSRPKIWGYPSILGFSLKKNPPNSPKNEKRWKKCHLSMVFCSNWESNDLPSWKNIGTHIDYYYLSRKFCFLCLKFSILWKIWKNLSKFGENNYLRFLLYVNWSWANYFLISNDFPNELRASLMKFNQSKQVAQVNARKW